MSEPLLPIYPPERPSHNPWTKPQRREFHNGVAAFRAGVSESANPWGRYGGGKLYGRFEACWREGWRAAAAFAARSTPPEHEAAS